MLHLGPHAFESIGGDVVQTTAFVFKKVKIPCFSSIFIRAADVDSAIDKEVCFKNGSLPLYREKCESFLDIDGAPFGYWLSDKAYLPFKTMPLISDRIAPRIGMITGDNDRFLRFWYEVSFDKISFCCKTEKDFIKTGNRWAPYSKGGEFRKWYGDNSYVVNWERGGDEIKNDNFAGDRIRSHNYNGSYAFQKGITWSSLYGGSFSCRYSEYGFIYDAASPLCLVKKEEDIFPVMAFLSSNVAGAYFKVLNPTVNMHPGYLEALPYPKTDDEALANAGILAKENVELEKEDWDCFETSWDFKTHPFLRISGGNHVSLQSVFGNWEKECQERFECVRKNECSINSIFINEYGLTGDISADVPDCEITVNLADKQRDVRSFLSYLVGITVGRYSLDFSNLAYAGGDWDSSKYKTYQPDSNGIEVINSSFFGDISLENKCIALVKNLFGQENLEENITFIGNCLNKKLSPRDAIDDYFLNGFYSNHLKIYQKRPIYWLFDSGPKNSFKAIVYAHRYCQDTLATLRTDYILPLLDRYSSRIDFLAKELPNFAGAESVKATKELESLKAKFQELSEYEPKVHHLADRRVSLNLDDGVKSNYQELSDVLAPIK